LSIDAAKGSISETPEIVLQGSTTVKMDTTSINVPNPETITD
jgi:hypothetical protein